MTSFEVGDTVKVVSEETARTGEVGNVIAVKPDSYLPYVVHFRGNALRSSANIGYKADEIEVQRD